MADIDVLAETLRTHFPSPPKPVEFGWDAPALNVIDCVLSLNRRYESFALPRVEEFSREHAGVKELASLRELIMSYDTPLAFSEAALNYRDEQRASVLLGVTDYLLREQHNHKGSDERSRLKAWAIDAKPSDYLLVGVKGFAIAGFQYLRMLFGAQTTKPDVHIRSFVAEAVGHPVTEIEALLLLEEAARKLELPVRDVDYMIWRQRSGGSQ